MKKTLPAFNSLKSVTGSLSDVTPIENSVILPPKDGAKLQSVYDAETRYMRLMRAGAASALWYDWVPELSLSVSAREAARLGPIEAFKTEPVAIRGTGGTVVPQGPGTINISVLSRHPRHPGIPETYKALCAALQQGFFAMGLKTEIGARPGSFCDGDYNILHQGRKLVGTAQRWAMAADGTAICLQHCVILSGGTPEWLCSRAEMLYRAARMEIRYDRNAHSGVLLNRDELAAAMDKPLQAFIDHADEDCL